MVKRYGSVLCTSILNTMLDDHIHIVPLHGAHTGLQIIGIIVVIVI